MLRIIAGKYRHLIIDVPNVTTTRPTLDKVREALMSALGTTTYDATCLDLFAGSGALGIESLSRGSKKVYFCDNNRAAFKTIQANLDKLHIPSSDYQVLFGSYKAVLERLRNENVVFDLIYLDPPYAYKEVYKEVIDYLIENNMLSKHAVIVKEGNEPFQEDERFTNHKSYKYGIVYVMIERGLE